MSSSDVSMSEESTSSCSRTRLTVCIACPRCWKARGRGGSSCGPSIAQRQGAHRPGGAKMPSHASSKAWEEAREAVRWRGVGLLLYDLVAVLGFKLAVALAWSRLRWPLLPPVASYPVARATLAAALELALQAAYLFSHARCLIFGSRPAAVLPIKSDAGPLVQWLASWWRLAWPYPGASLAASLAWAAISGAGSLTLLHLHRKMDLGLAATATIGAILGTSHILAQLWRGAFQVQLPAVRCRRIVMARQQVLPAVVDGASTIFLTIGVAALMAAIAPFLRPALSVTALIYLVPAMATCAFGWAWAVRVAALVLTEDLPLPPSEDMWSQLVAGATSSDSQLSFLALKAIADLSEGPENLKAARLALFADRTGKAWEQVASLCMAEMAVVARLSSELTKGGETSGPVLQQTGPVRWNVHSGLATKSHRLDKDVLRRELACGLVVRQSLRIELAVRTLAGLMVAARSEDTYGLVQLQEPGFGRLLSEVASLLLAAKALQAQRAEREGLALAWPLVWLASWLGQVHGRATRSLQLVEDTATQAIYQIVDTYGADGAGKAILEEVSKTKKPAYGTGGDVVSTVKAALSRQL